MSTTTSSTASETSIVPQALQAQNQSASQLLTAVALGAAVAAGALIFFFILWRLSPRIYSPRAYVTALPPEARTDPLPRGLKNAFRKFFSISDRHVLNAQSLDAYLLLRLLKVSVYSCMFGCLITWPILFPLDATGPGGARQLSILTMSNAVNPAQVNGYSRYFAHVFCAYIFFGFVLYMITRETIWFINIRQAHLVAPHYANRVSSRTVLFSSVPNEYLDETNLRQLLGEDVVENVWIPRHISKLVDLVNTRNSVAQKLEAAEIKLIQRANKQWRKQRKNRQGEELRSLNKEDRSRQNSVTSATSAVQSLEGVKRPTHRLKLLLGEKVDTIGWCRERLATLIPAVEELQAHHRAGKGEPHNSVFVEFSSLRDAQSAFQSLTHHEASRMAPRFTGIDPRDVIWHSLRIKWWERVLRRFVVLAGITGFIFMLTIPVAALQGITNGQSLATLPAFGWLGFLSRLPGKFGGLVAGVLPTILLLIISAVVAPILRMAHVLAGEPTNSAVEYALQNSYFAYQVIQVFVVTTIADGLIKTAAAFVNNPESILSLLANTLPAASNFYLSYVVLQGLGVVASTMLGAVSLILYSVMGLIAKSPRSQYNRWVSLTDPGLGSLYPVFTTLFIIGIAYSCIAPLVMGLAGIGLGIFYLAYKYQFLYVYDAPYDTKGLMYARALQQLFVGLYLAQLCLVAIFATQIAKSRKVIGPLVLMIIFLVFTVLYHYSLNHAFEPLLHYLPKTLETEEQRLLAADAAERGEQYPEYKGPDSAGGKDVSIQPINERATDLARTQPKPNWLRRWLRPDLYENYYVLRRMVPKDIDIHYEPDLERRAYFHPAVNSEPMRLWVPMDPAGVSSVECRETSKVIAMEDSGGAYLDEKGKIVWEWMEDDKPPIWKEKTYW